MSKRFAAWIGVSLALLSPRAFANGRFPRSERLLEHPSDPNALYLAATYGLLATKDRGVTWRYLCEASFAGSSSYTGDPLLDFAADQSLFVGVQSSIFVSSDQGCNWVPTLRNDAEFIVDHAFSKSNPSKVVALVAVANAGTVVNALRESLDNGRTWKPVGNPLPVDGVLTVDIDPLDPDHFYATGLTIEAGQFLTSADRGMTWSVHPIPNTNLDAAPYLAAIHPLDPRKIFVRTDTTRMLGDDTGGDSLLYSDDGGTTWRPIFHSRASLLGFAISPDASTLLLGYGDPTFTGGASLQGPFGVFKSALDPFAFEQVYGGRVSCLSFTTSGVYVCASEGRDGFELAFSARSDFREAGGCLVPLLHADEVEGPLECGAQTSGALCNADWATSCSRLAACSSGAPPKPRDCLPNFPPLGNGAGDAGADAGAGGSTGAENPTSEGSGGCGCRTSGRRSGGVMWWWPLVVYGALARRKRVSAGRIAGCVLGAA